MSSTRLYGDIGKYPIKLNKKTPIGGLKVSTNLKNSLWNIEVISIRNKLNLEVPTYHRTY